MLISKNISNFLENMGWSFKTEVLWADVHAEISPDELQETYWETSDRNSEEYGGTDYKSYEKS